MILSWKVQVVVKSVLLCNWHCEDPIKAGWLLSGNYNTYLSSLFALAVLLQLFSLPSLRQCFPANLTFVLEFEFEKTI